MQIDFKQIKNQLNDISFRRGYEIPIENEKE
jgi:hypothetical protein